MTIAAPFRLSSAELRALLVLADVMSAVTTSPLPSDIDATSLGTFSPAEYSWNLPARLGKHLVYIGGRDSITARMIRTALAGGVRTFVFWNLNRWTRRSVRSLVLYKVSSRVWGVAQTLSARAGAAVARALVRAEGVLRRRFATIRRASAAALVRAEAVLRRRCATDLRRQLEFKARLVPENPMDLETPALPLLSMSLLETPNPPSPQATAEHEEQLATDARESCASPHRNGLP